MTKVNNIAWPNEYNDLKRIEEYMVCGICYEYMETSVMTPCSHNYCSLCIRKYLHYKTQCPACFHVFIEKDLYINRAMDGIIQHYIQIRGKLLDLIENRNISSVIVQEEILSTPPTRPARSNQFCKSAKVPEKINFEKDSPISNSSFVNVRKFDSPSPSTNKSPKVTQHIAKIFNTPKRREAFLQPVKSIKSVSCPVCSVEISESHINVHLDACLKREQAEGITKKESIPKRPPLPKLVLRVMKDAELRKKMKEFGLSAHGDRKTLENRFTRYSVIYNAECDKLVPRGIAELIKQCEIEEKQERKLDSFLVSASTSNRLKIEKNAKEERIEEAQKNYRNANKSSFDKLIEDVKSRSKIIKKEETTESSSHINQPSTSIQNENVYESPSENEENTFKPSMEDAFQDIDSDESCPLQYRSDPLKSTTVNSNDSSSSTSTTVSPIKTPKKDIVLGSGSAKAPVVQENCSNPFEMQTDESTDEEIQASPILNRSINRKKFKLSNKLECRFSPAESTHFPSRDVKSIDKESESIVARTECNNISNDFSIEDFNDNSSGEFVDKSLKNEIRSIDEHLKASLKLDHVKSDGDTSHNVVKLLGENDNPVRSSNGSRSSDETLFSTMFFDRDGRTQQYNEKDKNDSIAEILGIPRYLENDVVTEKENDASIANENLESPAEESSSVSRPVRKSSRISRLKEELKQSREKKAAAAAASSDSIDESWTSEPLVGVNSATLSSDGPLKRRRGRSKPSFPNCPMDESSNQPTRPVRRRQAALDHNRF